MGELMRRCEFPFPRITSTPAMQTYSLNGILKCKLAELKTYLHKKKIVIHTNDKGNPSSFGYLKKFVYFGTNLHKNMFTL